MPASTDAPKPISNRLLAALPKEEYSRLLPHLETFSLEFKKVLYQPDETIGHVYFPSYGVVLFGHHHAKRCDSRSGDCGQ